MLELKTAIVVILLPILGLLIQLGATQCEEEDVRLVGSLLEGRVEICSGGEWGTVCDDEWDDIDASVVCRQLGFSDQGAQAFKGPYTTANFGQGTGDVALREVYCVGNEEQLSQCITVHVFCSHIEDSSVRCQYNGNTSLVFEGAFLPNNSVVNLEDIDSTNGFIDSLVCVTNQTECCNTSESSWYLPDGNAVTPNSNFNQNKTYRQQMLLYRNGEEYTPNGVFQCEIKDTSNGTQKFYVGIYLEGLGKPAILSLRFDRASNTLVCLSIGGPATVVLWEKNGIYLTRNYYKESQTIMDTTLALYENNLTIVSSSVGVSGLYSCSISNARGNSSTELLVPDTACENGDALFKPGSNEVTKICYNNIYYDAIGEETVSNSDGTAIEAGCRVENSNLTTVVILGALVGLLILTGVIILVIFGVVVRYSKACFSREYDIPTNISQQYSVERLVNNALYDGGILNSGIMQPNLAYTASTIDSKGPEESRENIYELTDTADEGYEFPNYEAAEQAVNSH